jgi:hypothetical protein
MKNILIYGYMIYILIGLSLFVYLVDAMNLI